MRQQYLPLLLFAILAFFGSAGCSILNPPPAPTAIPFALHTSEDVFNAFARAGLQMQNPTKEMNVGARGAPSEFSDRYLFEVPRIAPLGGQVIVFASAQQLQAWQDYIERLRNDSTTRRDVVYVYVKDNVMVQLSASLTTAEANAYRDAVVALT
jgi:hypothetical protein